MNKLISYAPLWETMKRRGATTYTLRNKGEYDNISGSTILRLQKLYRDLQENGRVHTTFKSGTGLSTTTVHSLHLMLHCAFERAVKERLIQRNPTDDCIAPKVRTVEMNVLSLESIKVYLKAAAQRDALPMFYLELVSGLRKGELVALLWSDVDTTYNTISVSKQYVRNPNGECVLSQPKTENSIRLVSVPQEAIDLLITEHNKHPDSPYLFPSPITGEMFHPDSLEGYHRSAEFKHPKSDRIKERARWCLQCANMTRGSRKKRSSCPMKSA